MDTNGQVSQLPAILASEELKNSLKGPRGSNTERTNFTWGGGQYSCFSSQILRDLHRSWSPHQPRVEPQLYFSGKELEMGQGGTACTSKQLSVDLGLMY